MVRSLNKEVPIPRFFLYTCATATLSWMLISRTANDKNQHTHTQVLGDGGIFWPIQMFVFQLPFASAHPIWGSIGPSS